MYFAIREGFCAAALTAVPVTVPGAHENHLKAVESTYGRAINSLVAIEPRIERTNCKHCFYYCTWCRTWSLLVLRIFIS